MTFGELGDLVVLTLRDPSGFVRTMRRVDPPTGARWMALALAVSLSTLLAMLARLAFPLPADDPLAGLLASPAMLATVQFGALAFLAALITAIGRLFGGAGTFDDALLLIAWVELILVGLQAAQLALMVVLPGTGSLMSLVALGMSIYLTIALTRAPHGFSSTAKVAVTFIGGIFVMGFLLSLIAAAFGILPEVTP